MKKIWIALMIIILFISFSCNNKGDWAKPKSGEWVLNVDACEIIFTVNPDGKEITDLVTTFSNYQCGGPSSSTIDGSVKTTPRPTGWVISENKFKVEVDILSTTVVLTGSFNQAGDKASGECIIERAGRVCTYNWTSVYMEPVKRDNL